MISFVSPVRSLVIALQAGAACVIDYIQTCDVFTVDSHLWTLASLTDLIVEEEI